MKRLEGPVERQEPARHLFPDDPGIVPALDPEIAPQQLDHGEVRGSLAVRDGDALDQEAVLDTM